MAKVTNDTEYHAHHLSWGGDQGGFCDHCGHYVADGDGIFASNAPDEVLVICQRFNPELLITRQEIEDGALDDGRYCSDECLLCDLLPVGFEYADGQIKEEEETEG